MADTALTVISDASSELGLGAVSAAFGSTDANVAQLCALLKSTGRKLRRQRSWKLLQRSYAFLTAQNQGRYALPGDYGRFIPDTAWNRTNRLPVPGPMTPAEYQALKARLVGVVYNVLYRVLQGNFQAFPDNTTPGSWVIAYEYDSDFWVTPAGTQATSGTWNNLTVYAPGAFIESSGGIYSTAGGGTSGSHNPVGTGTGISDGGIADWAYVSAAGSATPAADGDTVRFSGHLMSRALKLAWLQAKGLDTTAATADYNEALLAAGDDDSQGKTLSITRGRGLWEPILSARNFPDTGYGA